MTMGDCLRTNKLIILRGNSGSGKTTIAKELQQVFGNNTMLISQDVIRRDMLKVKDGENTKALPLLEELLRYGRKHSEIVILEGILNAEWYRALFELAVALYGKNIYAYYFDIPFEIDHLRNIGNELFEAFGVHYLLAFQPIRKFHHRFLSHAVDE